MKWLSQTTNVGAAKNETLKINWADNLISKPCTNRATKILK